MGRRWNKNSEWFKGHTAEGPRRKRALAWRRYCSGQANKEKGNERREEEEVEDGENEMKRVDGMGREKKRGREKGKRKQILHLRYGVE